MNGQASSQLVHTYEHTPNLNLAPVPGPSNAYQPDLLLLQVKAFLEAAEDVEVDPETIQELIQLISDREPTNVVDETPDVETEDDEWLSRQEHLLHNDHDDDLDISALFNNNVHDGIGIHISLDRD